MKVENTTGTFKLLDSYVGVRADGESPLPSPLLNPLSTFLGSGIYIQDVSNSSATPNLILNNVIHWL